MDQNFNTNRKKGEDAMSAKLMTRRLLTSKEVCERLAVSAGTLSRWRTSGNGPLPVVWLGPASPRYRESDVTALVEGPPATGQVDDQ
jgi:predicted DNA-binding transcriptional regulator AlpA